jgi:glycerol 3-phosphatase-2
MHRTDLTSLIARYDVFLLDIYGVLVSSAGALPGAPQFLRRLRDAGKHFLLVSNDASRSVDTALIRYSSFGLELSRDQFLCSGMMLADYYAARGWSGKPTIVLGTQDSAEYVRAAGGRVVSSRDESAEVIVLADDVGYPLLETSNDVVSVLLARLDAGLHTELVLPNPDHVFPSGPQRYGIASGAIAAMIEAVLRLRAPNGELRFVPLGKPHAPIFEAALRRSPIRDKRRIVMIGDQFVTDVRGARDIGIDSVFIETGVGRLRDAEVHGIHSTWVLSGLAE